MAVNEFPKWLTGLASIEDIKALEDAITLAEQTTSGELVVIIAKRCVAVHQMPFLIFLLISLLIWVMGGPTYLQNSLEVSWWIHLLWVVPVFLISRLLSSWPLLQRLLIPLAVLETEVVEQAELEFYRSNLTQTQGRTGILLFLSLFERQAVVLADRAIAEKLPPETWDGVVQQLVAGLRKQRLLGIKAAIQQCGIILSEKFPIKEGDKNELSNRIQFREYKDYKNNKE